MTMTQTEWLKRRIADLQLPEGKRDRDTREKFLLQCGMPEHDLAADMLAFLKDFVEVYKGMQDGDGEEAPELARARELMQRAEGQIGATGAAMATPPTEVMIDRAAQYLRETKQASQAHLLPWDRVAKSAKKKWLVLAKGTLEAALKND